MKQTSLLTLTLFIFSLNSFSQDVDKKTVSYFEKYIISGTKPPDDDVQIKTENDYRVIVWNDILMKSYKYSNEAFDKLGYELVNKGLGDSQQRSNLYRCCSKGILVEVTEWYNIKLSISIQWYTPSIRQSIGYLNNCETKKQTTEEVAKDVYDLFAVKEKNKFKNTIVDYSDRKNKPQLIDGSIFLKDFYYELIQKKNENISECIQIVINKDLTKELKTNWQKEGVGHNKYDIDKIALYTSYTTFIKNELPKLNFTNPKEKVYGDSILTDTRIRLMPTYEMKYLGVVKVEYDPEKNSATIKGKDISDEIETEDLVEYFKGTKQGTYKLSYYKVKMALTNCHNEDEYFGTTKFIGYKIYEKGDEFKTN